MHKNNVKDLQKEVMSKEEKMEEIKKQMEK